MNIVVSNTSPLRYMIWIGEQDVLPQLFRKIVIPQAVSQELTHTNAPEIVQAFMHSPPEWLERREVKSYADASLCHLDIGERETIVLAEQLAVDLVLMDEKKGRLIAKDRGLNVIGVLGILTLAAVHHKIDLPQAVEKLLQTNFKVSPSLIHAILEMKLPM